MKNHAAVQLSDLAKAFDLKKYNACASFGAAEWYNNLMHRTLRRSTATKHRDHYFDELKKGADYCLENPIASSRNVREGDGYAKNVFRSQVKDQTALDYLTGHWLLNSYAERAPEYADAFATMDREVHGETKFDVEAERAYETLDVPAWRMMNDLGLDLSGEVGVKVDLYASEEKLIDDFRTWLRATRDALRVPDIQRRLTRIDFDKWHKNRILAYLDLIFWADINGYLITNHVIGVALFPDEYNVNLSERIRKTVSTLALSGASEPYLEALLSQALETVE